MKIEFDKALLWLLPYLYLVSIAYYWGYWGFFNIDVFNYYPASDLIKGVTAPLGQTLLYVSGLGVLVLITKHLIFRSPVTLRTFVILGVFFFIVLVVLVFLFHFIQGQPHYVERSSLRNKAYVSIGVLCIIAIFLEYQLPEATSINSAIRSAAILFFLLLPFQAHLEGLTKATRINLNEQFDYVVTDSLIHSEKVYKYLGKAGDYQILISQNGKKRIIISASKLNPLIIETFFWKDSASVNQFKKYQKLH